ncbi:MAG: hypothetical protein L6R39_005111 [Caloplaca ligustica]|nr:MAG: hypothetical protein L6R39_005111 [Caloplaca ligustica]
MDRSGSSSPDPLAISQTGSYSPKAKARESLIPRKALGLTTGNAQARAISMATSPVQKIGTYSPAKDRHNEASPWRIRITVQAEQDKRLAGGMVPQCSPSKVFAERTFTTTVALKDGDEHSSAQRRRKGTPRKPHDSSSTERSTSRSRKKGVPKPDTMSPATREGIGSSPAPKRGRGRPRKSIDPPRTEHSSRKAERTGHGAYSRVSKDQNRSSSLDQRLQNQLADPGLKVTDLFEPGDQYYDFDSVMESEGFSMVSVSSLPSAQSTSSNSVDLKSSGNIPVPIGPKRLLTPSTSDDPPQQPPPPRPAVPMSDDREIAKPRTGTPKLARVVRAGIALQGVLSPKNQRSALRTTSPSPFSSTASPTERLDDLFSGFGPGTRRELRAGLRLGEELAKRQGVDNRPHPHQTQASEDVFAHDPDIHYPILPDTGAAMTYNLKVPGAARNMSPSFSNTQLPSPARSEAGADDDRMNWKFDTVPQCVAVSHSEPMTSANVALQVAPAMDRTGMEREAEWQREREAVSKQIQDANSSQVIVIDSDDEDECSKDSDEDGDIWLEEARNSRPEPSISDVPPIFRQTEVQKPRRSQLPSPWMSKRRDVLESTANSSDLSSQPTQTEVARKAFDILIDNGTPDTGSSTLESFSGDNDSPLAKIQRNVQDEIQASRNEGSADRGPQLLASTQEEDQTEEPRYHIQRVSIPHEERGYADSANESEDDVESEERFTDDEDLDSHTLSQQSMQDALTEPLDEGTGLDADISTSSTTGGFEEDVPEPQTPVPATPASRAETSKHVTFSTEKPRLYPAVEAPAPRTVPLPPAAGSWFSRVTSILPIWGTTTAPAAIPLPTRPKHTIVLPKVDHGPLPMYMPWTQSHWWALIHVIRQSQADATVLPYTSTMACAKYLGTVVSVKKWSKKITKLDCAVLQQFLHVLKVRGTVKGVEATLVKGGKKKQWGKGPGELVDMKVILSAVVAQWACDVQDGICTVGWSDRAGVKAGSEREIWSKADLEVDGPRVVYVL